MSKGVSMAGLSTRAVQMLLREADYLDGKDARWHNMGVWVGRVAECGTASCAVGDMMLRGEIPEDIRFAHSVPLRGMEGVAEAIGIPYRDAHWLFGCSDCGRFSAPRLTCIGYLYRSEIRFDRVHETPAQTAARIRKYVYWRLRKAEILADDDSRYREGDWRVDREVREQVEKAIA